MSEREERFERMLQEIQAEYAAIERKMSVLRAEGKTRTVTFRQLMGNKLMYQSMLSMYREHGLIE
ncbi:MAG: hypothetical protein Q4G06_13795 [Clostridia bacterium]|nr:hypothetical protein [Clostridia bacterium]